MQDCIKLSRSELFDTVWETPLLRLAKQYGISNVAIKKKCVKYDIPTPPRGYWAKKAAGHKVKTPRLAVGEYNPEIKIRPYRTKKISKKTEEKKIIPDRLNKPSKIISEAKKTYCSGL